MKLRACLRRYQIRARSASLTFHSPSTVGTVGSADFVPHGGTQCAIVGTAVVVLILDLCCQGAKEEAEATRQQTRGHGIDRVGRRVGRTRFHSGRLFWELRRLARRGQEAVRSAISPDDNCRRCSSAAPSYGCPYP
eukprot:scaffold2961_cov118-Isochrysis_galbana.AAC.4